VTRRGEAGSTSLELILLAPVLLSIMLLIAAFGRHANVQSYVDQAARDAARTATASRDGNSAKEAVQAVITGALETSPTACQDSEEHTVESSSGQFEASSPYYVSPLGDDAGQVVITVTVSCEVDVSDLSFIGFGQTLKLTSTFSSPMPASYGVYP